MENRAPECENGHLKEHSLETEYALLYKESLEIITLLRQARQKKRMLQAEVRFLRQRAELLEEVSSQAQPASANQATTTTTSSTELDDDHQLVQHLKPCHNTSVECFFVATNTNFIDLEDEDD